MLLLRLIIRVDLLHMQGIHILSKISEHLTLIWWITIVDASANGLIGDASLSE